MSELSDYLNHNLNKIQGWCGPHVWLTMEYIDRRQRDEGKNGPICEIGVYKGKYFIGLARLKHDAKNHLAIDVFEEQEFNLAGAGQRVERPAHATQFEEFSQNMKDSGVDLKDVHILKADSLALRDYEICQYMGAYFRKFSIFSIDGCHEFTHAHHNLSLAFSLTASNGVIMVDDYYNPSWPGVHEAVAKHYFSGAPVFVPLFWIRNKLALCHVNYHETYIDGLKTYLSEKFGNKIKIRVVTRYGWETLSLEPSDNTPLLANL